MESTPVTPSVIAKLMGLDESLPQPPVQKQGRVLSENYLRRVASIGGREKRRSFRLKVDQEEFKDFFEVVDTMKEDKHDNVSVEKGKSEASMDNTKQNEFQVSLEMMDYEDDHFPKCIPEVNSLLNKHLHNVEVSPFNSPFGHTPVLMSPYTPGSGNVDPCRQSGRKYEQSNVTLLQPLQYGIVTESLGEVGLCNLHKFPTSQLESTKEGCFPSTRIVVLNMMGGKAENPARCSPSLSPFDFSHSVDGKCKEFPSPGSGKIHVQVEEKKKLAYDMEPINLRSTVSRKILGNFTRSTRWNKTNIETKVSRSGSRSGNSVTESELTRLSSLRYQSFAFSDEAYVARESKKQLLEQWKLTKKFEVGMGRRGITLGNLLAMPANETRTREKLVSHDLKDLDLSKFRTQQDKYIALCNEWTFSPKRSINWGQHKSREYIFNQNDGLRYTKLGSIRKKFQFPVLELKGIHTEEKISRNFNKHQSGTRTCIFADENDGSSSHVTDTSVQQEPSIEVYKESPFLLNCSTPQPDCMANLDEVYQPSPVSVLEPLFRGERSPTPEFPGRINVDITEYSDTYSEGSGMIVSSDDEANEGSGSSYTEDEDLMRLFRVEESRNFSYLVDVLSEIGFYGRNSTMNYGPWCSPELPVSLSVFETLEKKFGDQMSWNRSDRRLLFDRINAGLMEILEPCMGVPAWTKPVSRRIRSWPGQEMIEEHLWTFLVSQEKEIGKNLAEKVLGSEIELDLRDDIDGIGREIERFLFDELVAEFVCLESF